MVSGPNLNETSIVSGGYGGTAEGIIPTSSIKGRVPLHSWCLTYFWHLFSLFAAILSLSHFDLTLCHLSLWSLQWVPSDDSIMLDFWGCQSFFPWEYICSNWWSVCTHMSLVSLPSTASENKCSLVVLITRFKWFLYLNVIEDHLKFSDILWHCNFNTTERKGHYQTCPCL